MLTFRFTGADGSMVQDETLTAGMVKKEVKLEFSSDWDDMTKTVVFSAGLVTRAVTAVSDVAVIPAEVLAVPLKQLYVGVYGVSSDGKVTPTIRVKGPEIKPGTDPSCDEGTDPDLAVWAQLQQEIDALKEHGVEGAAGGYYIPAITQTDENTMCISFVASEDWMIEVESKEIPLPVGRTEDSLNGLTEAQISALDGMFKVCAFTKADVSAEYSAFQTAFGLPDSGDSGEDSGGDDSGETEVTLTRITAMYSGDDVAVGTELTELTGITVTAYYSDGSTQKVTDYTLSGTIAEGENTITVTYEGMTATFTVTGVAEAGDPDILYQAANLTFDGVDDVVNTGVAPFAGDKDWTIVTRFTPETFVNNADGKLQKMPAVFLVGAEGNHLAIRLMDDEYGVRFYFSTERATTGGVVKPFVYGNEYAYTITHEAASGVYNLAYTGGTASVSAADFVSSAELNIGCNTMNDAYGFFHGTVADFKVYNRVLTDEELTVYIG